MVGRYGMVVKHDLEREMKMKQSVSSHGHKKFVHFLVTFVTLIGIVGGGGRSSRGARGRNARALRMSLRFSYIDGCGVAGCLKAASGVGRAAGKGS